MSDSGQSPAATVVPLSASTAYGRAALLDSYRAAPRTERCACGGEVVAGPSEREILEAMRLHQATDEHSMWWAANPW